MIDAHFVPRFRPSLHVAATERDCAYIISERRSNRLGGEQLVALLQAIDGVRSVSELTTHLSDRVSPPDVIYLVEQLLARDYLVDADSHACDERAAFEELMGWRHATPLRVSLRGIGTCNAENLKELLLAGDVEVAERGDLIVCLVDDYLNPAIEAVLRAPDAPVLLAKVHGTRLLIGPIFGAGDSFCLHCLQYWLRHNRPVQTLLERRKGSTISLPKASHPASMAIASGLIALAIQRYAEGDRSLLRGMESLDLASMQSAKHQPTRRPQCPVCGDPGWMQHQAMKGIDPRAESELPLHEGGFRTVASGETLRRHERLVDATCGPVAYLHAMPGRHIGTRKVYVSGYLVCPTAPDSSNPFDKVCAGKGETDDDARASALCEALERFSSVFQGDEPRIRSSTKSLGASAIALDALQHFSHEQVQRRDIINAATRDRRRQVPKPLPDDAHIDWTTAWCLNDGSRHAVPLVYCFAETPPDSGHAYGIYNPNGTAAGNCLEEAILQGLLELIERDAVAIWWYNRIPRPAIDLSAFADTWLTRLVDDYATDGWRLWVLDLTHDLRIPVCAALAHHARRDRYAIGFGCHLTVELAVKRAITELNQLLDPSVDAPSPWDREQLKDASFLEPSSCPAEAPQLFPKGTLRQYIDQCVDTFARAGMSSFFVNKSRPDIGLSVAQVIVPGLRHFWPRFGAGRLYEVPVQLGWLCKPTPEEHLNPAPLFL
ncbi:TOMM precursor leader peptide-binding protein [Dyella mobilis]|uniref:TOMM leader peptide-binding protein n=1 Tax=Dyella mobilis TaxID=1849582 RepID=A0ABS2KBW4_9GAMM|nr:TOMM precursor leader peptide-binding protein [Dyella mobilis]MBM7128305.1 TOMM precursor leader peptide-binding protein [Dyella mobilis]GLQ99866.1 hypothetical protein GCM10007863_42860 [Dyella mobilis]